MFSEEIPQNIRHKFGTNETEKLLQDQLKVHDTLSNIQNKGINKKVDKSLSCDNNVVNRKNLNGNMNLIDFSTSCSPYVAHENPFMYSKSTTAVDFNADINKEYLSDKKNLSPNHRQRLDSLGNKLNYIQKDHN